MVKGNRQDHVSQKQSTENNVEATFGLLSLKGIQPLRIF